MSHLFNRLSKLSTPLNRFLCSRRSEFSTTTTPYLLLGVDSVGKSPCGDKVVNYNLYDPSKEEHVKLEDQNLSNNLRGYSIIGSSRGWFAFRRKRDSEVRLVNIFDDPSKTISFPPLLKEETENLLNVSVSSSSFNEDCLVAARFSGSRLSWCRLGDSEWTRVDVPCPDFHLSPVMFSDRDNKFYLSSSSSKHTSDSGLVSPVYGYLNYPLCCHPKYKNYMDLQSQHNFKTLVEAPSGESFIVRWSVDLFNDKGEVVAREDKTYTYDVLLAKTQNIRVYRQDDKKKKYNYTEDIGDLCIFVGENEPFCLPASKYPGLKANSVYFAGHMSGFGVCDLASRSIRYLSDSPPSRHRLFWLPPTTPQ